MIMNEIAAETVTAIRDAVRSIAHWTDQERRATTERDRITRTLATTPADHYRRTHLETQVRTLTERAQGSAQRAQEARERLTTLTSVTLVLPGAFDDWFEGTGIGQGQTEGDPEAEATRVAWEAGAYRRYGRNGHTRTITTDSLTVLDIFHDYAGYCADANDHGDTDPREVRALHTLYPRIKEARATLRALLAVRTEAEEQQAEYEAYYAATFAVGTAQEAHQGPQEAPAAPAAPQEARPVHEEAPTPSQTLTNPGVGQGVKVTATAAQGRPVVGIVEFIGPAVHTAARAAAGKGPRHSRLGLRQDSGALVWVDGHTAHPAQERPAAV
jgi:hypothetical protein